MTGLLWRWHWAKLSQTGLTWIVAPGRGAKFPKSAACHWAPMKLQLAEVEEIKRPKNHLRFISLSARVSVLSKVCLKENHPEGVHKLRSHEGQTTLSTS